MPFIHASDLSLPKENVALAITKGYFGSHIGLIFHSAKDGLKLMHLAFHKDLKSDNFPHSPPQCWVATQVNLPPTASKALVAMVRAISKHSPKIKYGINFMAARGSFDFAGSYMAPKGSDGLTCATFVAEIFRAVSLPLISEETWPSTIENAAWGKAVCDLMEKHGAEPEHVAHVRANIIGLRVRPEEIAAASAFHVQEWPVQFEVASDHARSVMIALGEICNG